MHGFKILVGLQAVVGVLGRPQAASGTTSGTSASSTSAATATVPVSTGAPSITLTTAVPAPTAPLASPIPSQAALPPTQAWCPSKIFCAGEILQVVNIAAPYSDPKTIVDKPTNASSQQVVSNFNNLVVQAGNSTANITEQQVVDFLNTNFRGEGLELEAQALPDFNPTPKFLSNVSDPLVKSWSQTVHGFWTQLIRGTNSSTLCNGVACESSLIPLNHTFVVPGGRFREQYYWDSYWIVQGLIQSELFEIVNATLQNFMDELEKFGFIPNGGRIYYLNRSQPPLFIHMLAAYVEASNDTAILTRALPLAERELQWWQTNRTISVKSPFTNKTYDVNRYSVTNTAPRPESYLQDYTTANGPDLTTPLNETQKSDLYGELATGAETGWDYSVRWFKEPLAGGTNNTNLGLRTLNIKNLVPLCLNSILYKSRLLLADLYSPPFSPSKNTSNAERASFHRGRAATMKAAILDLMWDPEKLAFYDFNRTANARSTIYSAAHFYPLWSGIIPDEVLKNETAAFGMFAGLNMVLNRYNGTFPTTLIESGLQWDAPNAWPPHQYIALAALQSIPANLSTKAVPTPASGQSSFNLIPAGQLGIDEGQLLGQPMHAGGNATVPDLNTLNGTVFNGGNATSGETWAVTLQRELANRYITSALCSWHATGGSIPNVLPRLSNDELNVTQSTTNTGNMFEKFSALDVDSAGRGGEYTVQAGFGWTNGVVLWIASNYGKVLVAPSCPPLLAANAGNNGSGTGTGTGSAPGSTGTGTSGSSAAAPRGTPSVAMVFSFLLVVAGALSLV